MRAHKIIPATAFPVSHLCLGGDRLGGGVDQKQSFALLDAFVGARGNLIDTAPVYANWLPEVGRSCSENILGCWRKARGASTDLVIATKVDHPPLTNGQCHLDRASLRHDVQDTCDYLGIGCLPLVYLHRDDPARDAAYILGGLEEFCVEGRISRYAASNWTAARLAASTRIPTSNGWQGFVPNQADWSLDARNPGTAAEGFSP